SVGPAYAASAKRGVTRRSAPSVAARIVKRIHRTSRSPPRTNRLRDIGDAVAMTYPPDVARCFAVARPVSPMSAECQVIIEDVVVRLASVGPSAAAEARLATLEVGGDPLAHVLARVGDVLATCLVLERLLEGHRRARVQEPLRQAERERRPRGEAPPPLLGHGIELRGRNDAVHEPDRLGLLRVDHVGEERELLRLPEADETRQEP